MSAPHFNLIGRLTRLLHTTDGTAPGSGWGSGALAGYDYAYDAATRLTEIDSFVDGLTEYTHDNTSQLTAADHTGQTDETYAYDENGNRTGGGYVTGDNNQTTEDGVYTYTYDAEGNRLTRTRVSDSYVTAYEWDHRNRLVSVTELDDMETVLAVTEHDYDAFNQWIRRTVDADGPGSGPAVDTLFAHHDGQIVYQFDGETAADLTNRYLWNPAAVDHLLVDEVVANLSTAGDLQFPLGDHLGTIRDIAEYDAGTDTTTIANHIRYNSFGAVISETNSAIDLLFGFTSRPFDDSTGLQNNLHRWYDSALGQWASEDPIGFSARDPNVRRYVSNKPLVMLDAVGLNGNAFHDAYTADGSLGYDTRPRFTTQDVLLWKLIEIRSRHSDYEYFNAAGFDLFFNDAVELVPRLGVEQFKDSAAADGVYKSGTSSIEFNGALLDASDLTVCHEMAHALDHARGRGMTWILSTSEIEGVGWGTAAAIDFGLTLQRFEIGMQNLAPTWDKQKWVDEKWKSIWDNHPVLGKTASNVPFIRAKVPCNRSLTAMDLANVFSATGIDIMNYALLRDLYQQKLDAVFGDGTVLLPYSQPGVPIPIPKPIPRPPPGL